MQSKAKAWRRAEAESRGVNRIRWSSQPSMAENNLLKDPGTKALMTKKKPMDIAAAAAAGSFFRDDTRRRDSAEVERSAETLYR